MPFFSVPLCPHQALWQQTPCCVCSSLLPGESGAAPGQEQPRGQPVQQWANVYGGRAKHGARSMWLTILRRQRGQAERGGCIGREGPPRDACAACSCQKREPPPSQPHGTFGTTAAQLCPSEFLPGVMSPTASPCYASAVNQNTRKTNQRTGQLG